MEESKKINLKFWIIIILLIIIILILLFFMNFGKIGGDFRMPTGNVDVFDIDIDCDCIDSSGKVDYENCVATKDGKKKIIPVFNKLTDDDVIGEVFVDDKNGNYIYQQNLEIFTNAAFEYTNKIAPGSYNTYNFVAHNSTNIKLKYYLEMSEDSEYKINMKYRLRKNDNYIIGDGLTWVDASELETEFSNIEAGTSDRYSLDWKWEYEDGKDEEDTLAGENMTSAYKLKIRFYFEAA